MSVVAEAGTPPTLQVNSPLMRLLGGAGALVVATTLANVGNYLINLYLGRALGPAGFSEVTLLATFVLVTSIVTTAVELVISRMVAVRLVDANLQAVADLRRSARHAAIVIGLMLAAPCIIFADALADGFRMSSSAPFVVIALSFPVYLVLAVDRGMLLGQLRYARLGSTFIIETVVRLVASVAAVTLGLAAAGIAGAIGMSFVAAWLLARAAGDGLPRARGAGRSVWRELGAASAAAAAALLGQAILANSDIVFVKASFAPEVAGAFAAVALVGRAIFFATTSLSMALFPLVAARDERGQSHRLLLVILLLVVVVVCGSMTSVAWIAPEFVLSVFFGAAYVGGAELLGPYALAMSMLVGSSVIALYRLSLGRPRSGYLTLIAGLVLLAGFILVADSLTDVVLVMLAVNSGLLLATAAEAGLFGSALRHKMPVRDQVSTAVMDH